ncbi:MAG TPA: hypothetical protein VLV45_13445 [Gemmatimonadales bacterium]|nr:hypothetical protein [Gemmatimonadales bacterium]
MSSRHYWHSVAVLLVLAAAGCTGMVRVKEPASYLDDAHPKNVRVTRPDGTSFIMVGARVEDDTLMGFVQQWNGIHQFEELSLEDVSKLEAQQHSATKTGLAIGVGVLGFAGAWFALYNQAEHQGTSQFCRDGLYGAGIPCD